MLSKTNEKLLCDISPGSAMGDAFRGFWLPVLTSNAVEAGGDPVKFMAMCDSFVAFRSPDGAIAVFDEKCPHRGCSLELARVEGDSIRCIFHGWKFHVSGKCTETPNEPDPAFPQHVPLRSYPVRDAGGAVWVWLGKGPPPPFPSLIFNQLDPDQLCARRAVCDYNWLTGLEAILDPTHLGILHASWIEKAPEGSTSVDIQAAGASLAPRLDFEDTDYGFRYATLRDMPDGTVYLRVSEVVMPSGVFIAVTEPGRRLFIMSVPIDNYRSMQWYFRHSPDRPMSEADISWSVGKSDPDDNDFYTRLKGLPRWGQDRDAMRAGTSFAGFDDIMFEDFIVGESQGAWPDRTKEWLGPADRAIFHARQYLLARLKGGQGNEAEAALTPPDRFDMHDIQALAATIAPDDDWKAIVKEQMHRRADLYAPEPA